MKVAVIGSRSLCVDDLSPYLPPETTELVSGGAKGIDSCAKNYALVHGIKLTEFLPDYRRYGRFAAPLKRNETIVDYADRVVALWDGVSRGTLSTINYARKAGKSLDIHWLKKP
ncbi:MAG: DUF2493 domain-containing protein [Clostridia bacterium]|nr:DUF2493 domain-containing protein [Clostridia bacterium]